MYIIVMGFFQHLRGAVGSIGATVAVVLAGIGAGCAGGTSSGGNTSPDTSVDAGPSTEPAVSPDSPTRVETALQTSSPSAGSKLTVECSLLDGNGAPIEPASSPDYELLVSPESAFESPDHPATTPVDTGAAEVACAAPRLGLVDPSPVQFQVRPGPVHTVRTTLDVHEVRAGETATASCEATDEYGNPVPGASPTVEVGTSGSGISVDSHKVTITSAGSYRVACHVPGASREVGASLDVRPGLPASISMSPVPKQTVYETGSAIRFPVRVLDQHGNTVDSAPVRYSVTPTAPGFGIGAYKFLDEGTYTVAALVQGPTVKNAKLHAEATVTISGEGPTIRCKDPKRAAERKIDPGSRHKFVGHVSDPNGVKSVTVDGNTVKAAGDGSFSSAVDVRYGINFVDISSTDIHGSTNSTTCTFLAADHWAGEDAFLSGPVSLDLGQKALDDRKRNGNLDSLADILDKVINSSALSNRLDSALSSQNPLKDSCDQKIDIPFVGEKCVHSSTITYRGSRLKGPNGIRLDWINNGFRSDVTFQHLQLKLEIDSTSIDTKGWIKIDKVDVVFDSNVGLQNHRPTASVRNVRRVDVGNVDLDFGGGLKGFLINAIQSIFQSQIQGQVESQIRSYLKNDFDKTLAQLFSSLDVRSLGQTVDVQSLGGSGNVKVGFDVRFSSLDVSSSRALWGLGTRFSPRNGGSAPKSKGIPLPAGNVLRDPGVGKPTAVSVHEGMLNQVLHALWRAGMFDAALGQSLIGGNGAPAKTRAKLDLDLPPVAHFDGSQKIEVMLGGAQLQLVYPGLFNRPTNFRVGLVAESGVRLKNNDELAFRNVKLTEFYFSSREISLKPSTRKILERFLRDLFQNVVDQSLNSGLPSLPLPSFQISRSIGKYGLPTGKNVGLTNPAFRTKPPHVTLGGGFGVR
ncbi:MAG: hypothetical protein ABEL76_00380 [Bradymonadaceae bacterium]